MERLGAIKYSGADWLEVQRKYWKNQSEPISQLGREVADILGQVEAGIYHMDDGALSRVNWSCEHAISIVIRDGPGLATHDGCVLADLVLLCFMMNIRLNIEAAAHGYLRLTFIRIGKWGYYRDNHPNLDEAIRRAQSLLAGILKEQP
jgi:hypothetical protein